MTAYMIVEENVTDPEGFQKYRQGESQPPFNTLGEKSLQQVERVKPWKGIGIPPGW